MSSCVGASGVPGSSRAGDHVCEDTGEELNNINITCRAGRQRLGDAGPGGEGRSGGLEQLARPPLPGRKAHRKTHQGRWREGIQERELAEHVVDNERRRGLQRWTERTEAHAESSPFRQGREVIETLSGSNSDVLSNEVSEAAEGSSFQMGKSDTITSTVCLNAPSPRSPAGAMCSAPLHPSIQTRSASLSSRTSAEEPHHYPCTSSREPDPFWVVVRTGAGAGTSSQNQHTRTPIPSVSGSEQGEEEGEQEEEEEEEGEDGDGGGGGVMEVTSQGVTSVAVRPHAPAAERRMSKREKKRVKYLRRRQRRREVWRQGQLQESQQSSTGNASGSSSGSSSEEEEGAGEREGYICAVCLDVYFSPYMCHPCNHIFCEPCLRTLARNSPANTPCPLCRTVITHVFFQKELNQTARTFFPKEYLSRKQNFQKASCAKWPLPSCRKLFHIFGGFQRQPATVARRQLPRGGGYQLDSLDFRGDARGWRLDMDMVIIYIYSVNWVVGFFVFCFLCYLFFPSF
ncbi:uncharacterized protein rnf180a isoform X1 [Takifugu flavidus]|uniref:uncharacterized protein rnf180a isoform X1 n=1 Tax=Takifugu flavidus TaxID=433684 RepID=UPI0025441381|nr:uncharacterized protein rnf180a isoform X1 [Takifugu flavidus]